MDCHEDIIGGIFWGERIFMELRHAHTVTMHYYMSAIVRACIPCVHGPS